jgi:hypothetical protein
MDSQEYWRTKRLGKKKEREITYTLDMQGKRITLKMNLKTTRRKVYTTRSPIYEFSRRARARKLRRIAEVNWAETGDVQFITVTYPDSVSDHTMEERKTHRFLLNRWICRVVGRPLACFWRVEWMPRLTGEFVGELRPHMHFLYLKTPHIPEQDIRLRWQSILGVSQYVQVKIKHLVQAEKVAVYVAKYCSKEQTNTYLDCVPKRNRTGRHAGELRRSLIPVHKQEVIERVNQAIVLALKRRACEILWWYDPLFDEGFTILGQDAVDLIRDIHENYLDGDAKE